MEHFSSSRLLKDSITYVNMGYNNEQKQRENRNTVAKVTKCFNEKMH